MSGGTSGGPAADRSQWRWDVALSFAGAQRSYVEKVAEALKARGVRCFLDADEQIDLWGKYLAEELPVIYGEQAATVVVFVSADYAARDWTRLERRAALDRAVRERREYVLPARFDDTPLPGLLSGMVDINLHRRKPEEFAVKVAEKLAALGIGVAMSASEISRRHQQRLVPQRAIRLIPEAAYRSDGFLGGAASRYVFVGDYQEQRHRTLRIVLSSLGIGDVFERVENSNIRWVALVFEIGGLNRLKLDLKPATWKAAFRILSDPKRVGVLCASDEELANLGCPPRDYYSTDQWYWNDRIAEGLRDYTTHAMDYLGATLGISYTCYTGEGIHFWGTIPSRVFFVKNVSLSTISCTLQRLGTPDDDIVVE